MAASTKSLLKWIAKEYFGPFFFQTLLGYFMACATAAVVLLSLWPFLDRRSDRLRQLWFYGVAWLLSVQLSTAFLLQGSRAVWEQALGLVQAVLEHDKQLSPCAAGGHLLGAAPVAVAFLAAMLTCDTMLWDAKSYSSSALPVGARRMVHRGLLLVSVAAMGASFVGLTSGFLGENPEGRYALLFSGDSPLMGYVRGMEVGVTLFAGSFVVRLEASSLSKGVAGSVLGTALVLSVGGGDCVARLIGVAALVLLVGVGFPLTRLRGLFGGGYGAYGCGVAVCVVMVVARSVVAGFAGDGLAVLPAMGEGLNPVSILAVCCVCGAPLRWVQFFRKHLPRAGWMARAAAVIVCVGGTLAMVAAPFVGNPVIAARLVGLGLSTAVIPALPFWMFQQYFVADFVLLMRPWFHIGLMFSAYVATTGMVAAAHVDRAKMVLHHAPFAAFFLRLPSLVYVFLFSPGEFVVRWWLLAACFIQVWLGPGFGHPVPPALLYTLLFVGTPDCFEPTGAGAFMVLQVLILFPTALISRHIVSDSQLLLLGFLLVVFASGLLLACSRNYTVKLKPKPDYVGYSTDLYAADSLDLLLRIASWRGDIGVIRACTSWGMHSQETAQECLRVAIRNYQVGAAAFLVAQGARGEDLHGWNLFYTHDHRLFGLALACGVSPVTVLEAETLTCRIPATIRMLALVLSPLDLHAAMARLRGALGHFAGGEVLRCKEVFVGLRAEEAKVRRWVTGKATYILPRGYGEDRQGLNVLSVRGLHKDDVWGLLNVLRASCWTDRVGLLECCRVAWGQHGGRPVSHHHTHHAVLHVESAEAEALAHVLSLRRVCRTVDGGLVEPFGREVAGFL